MNRTSSLPLGIDVGASRICIAALRRDRSGQHRVEAVASRNVERHNGPTAPESIAAAIREAVAETGSRERRCIMSISARDGRSQRVRLPALSNWERRRIARFEASRIAAWDVEAVATSVGIAALDRDGEFVVGAVPTAIVVGRTQLARLSKLRAVAIDFEPFAAVRCFDRCDAVLDVGFEEARLYAASDPTLPGTRIAGGGEAFTAALQAELGIDRAQAERRKQTVGIAGAGETSLDQLISQIRTDIEHLREKRQLATLALIGNGWRVDGFIDRLSAAASVRILTTIQFSRADRLVVGDCADWALAASLAAWSL